MPNPLEVALAALIEETAKAEALPAERVSQEAGGAALSVLFGVPEPEDQAPPVEPPCEPSTASSDPGVGEIDWTVTDAAIEARCKAETPAPSTTDGAPVSSEPATDAALLAALTEGDTHP